MNRELKFRAYYEGKMHYNIDKHTIVYHELSGRDGDVWDFSDWLKYAKVQQYTGLKDSKGVEIYEGAIVDYKYDDEKVIAEIKYSEEYAAFLCGENALWQGWLGKAEVIGNIFENPELIKN